MRTCYVAIPFGRKIGSGGRELDFDFLYHEVISPAVSALDIECRRLDEVAPSALWQKQMLTAIISSDLMIADISTHNPNVLYEIGVRHALRRGRTILVSAVGERTPGNIAYAYVAQYEPDTSGRLIGQNAEKFRIALTSIINQSKGTIINDSPLYEFFPELEVVLPPDLLSESIVQRKRPVKSSLRGSSQGFVEAAVESPKRVIEELKKSEPEVRSTAETDPIDYLTLMKQYRDLSQWDEVINLAQDAPSSLRTSPELRQLLALALNRRGYTGDRDRAIALMEELITQTGGDSETFGILGRIHKDRFDRARLDGDEVAAKVHLDRALQSYRAGFEKNPKDYYPGINVVTLLQLRNGQESQAELSQILPRVRSAVRERIESGPVNFWDAATELQLAVVARDWKAAEAAADTAGKQNVSRWMLETTIQDLRAVRGKMDFADRDELDNIIRRLQTPASTAGVAG
jgi:tetratricopeptide (TPR) repeat protein